VRPPALSHLRVVESGQIISGPFCAHLFADHGAEVVKVEQPLIGDPMRRWGANYKGVGLYWPIIARGKKSVTADLRRREGQQAFSSLLATADVLVENFRPGTLERWNLGWEQLHALNPDLIVVRISGYGQTGPYKDKAGFGAIAEAMSGFRHLSGEPGRAPVRVGISIGDAVAGVQGFTGALLALLAGERDREVPRGQLIDVALYEAMWMFMEGILAEYEKLGQVRQPTGPQLPGIAPSSVYPTADSEWIVMGANHDPVFERLAAAMKRPDWQDPRSAYRTQLGRAAAQDQLDAEIAAWTSLLSSTEVLEILDTAGVPAGRINTAADIARDGHFRARQMIVDVPEPGLGGETVPMPGVVPILSDTPGRISRGAPLLGEHNDEIWAAVLGDRRLGELRAAGVV
jgi:crotonobetainyl-CoA:carnitine CoA-transferase CaiB-like acyl-CoA transferase